MVDENTGAIGKAEALATFKANIKDVDPNDPIQRQFFLDEPLRYGQAVGQGELYTNFIETLKGRQGYIQKFDEDGATKILAIVNETLTTQVELSKTEKEGHLSNFRGLEQQQLGTIFKVRSAVAEKLSDWTSGIAGFFGAVATMLGMTDLAKTIVTRAQDMNEWVSETIAPVQNQVSGRVKGFSPEIAINAESKITNIIDKLNKGFLGTGQNITNAKNRAILNNTGGKGSFANNTLGNTDSQGTSGTVTHEELTDILNNSAIKISPALKNLMAEAAGLGGDVNALEASEIDSLQQEAEWTALPLDQKTKLNDALRLALN